MCPCKDREIQMQRDPGGKGHGIMETCDMEPQAGTAKDCRQSQELGRAPQHILPWRPPERTSQTHNFIPDFWPPEVTENKLPGFFKTPRF